MTDTLYYYISGSMGMTSSGSFSRSLSRWTAFDAVAVESLNGRKPWLAQRLGAFVPTSHF